MVTKKSLYKLRDYLQCQTHCEKIIIYFWWLTCVSWWNHWKWLISTSETKSLSPLPSQIIKAGSFMLIVHEHEMSESRAVSSPRPATSTMVLTLPSGCFEYVSPVSAESYLSRLLSQWPGWVARSQTLQMSVSSPPSAARSLAVLRLICTTLKWRKRRCKQASLIFDILSIDSGKNIYRIEDKS